jgi:hypothetical protein
MVAFESDGAGFCAIRVDLPATLAEEAAYLAALESVAELPGPYGLLVEVRGSGPFTQGGRRDNALWFKANRARVEAACRGLAILRPEGGERSAAGFARMFAFPVRAVPDEAAARAFLAECLEGQAA